MPASILPATDCLTPADLASIVASCGRFEADWKEGRPRRIEDELSAADERIRSQLFHDLLQLEFELIYRAGRHASLDAYLARFPDRTETAREVFSETLVPSRQVLDPRMIEESASAPEGYELLRKLGEGGQAITFLARDLALQRLVVLKRYHGVASCRPAQGGAQHEGRAGANPQPVCHRVTGWRRGATRSTWSSNTSPAGRWPSSRPQIGPIAGGPRGW